MFKTSAFITLSLAAGDASGKVRQILFIIFFSAFVI